MLPAQRALAVPVDLWARGLGYWQGLHAAQAAERQARQALAQQALQAQRAQALADENVNIKVISTSEIKISVLIDRKYMELAVQALHDALELEKA